jgi:hypothetical protein
VYCNKNGPAYYTVKPAGTPLFDASARKRLQVICDKYYSECGLFDLVLTEDEWKQIHYLLSFTQPFFNFTTVLSETKDVTIHIVFSIYNQLFDHLERSIDQLRRKKARWQITIRTALEYAIQKFRDLCGDWQGPR